MNVYRKIPLGIAYGTFTHTHVQILVLNSLCTQFTHPLVQTSLDAIICEERLWSEDNLFALPLLQA